MASDGVPVNSPVTRLVHGSQASASIPVPPATGKTLPNTGGVLPATALAAPPPVKAADPAAAAKSEADLRALIARLNKALNDSGQPNQFRVDPTSGNKVIQEINPATGAVVGEYSTAEFPALARGLGVSGLVFDGHA
jgi:uncharacterized FlaG/YvyC family protein